MQFCSECGFQHDGAKFCPNCGKPQGQAAGTAQYQQSEVEQEKTVWEGDSMSLTNIASGGRLVSCRYRLTNKAIYFDEGLMSTTSQQVPLWAVRDIDVHQGLLQKSRGIGTVTVHVEHSDYTGLNKVELKDIQVPTEVRDELNKHAQRERLEYDRRQKTQYYGQDR